MANINQTEHGKQIRLRIQQAIIEYTQQHGYSPTFQEIGDMVGLSSKANISAHIIIMLDTGMLETDAELPGTPRAMRVPGYKFVKEEDAQRLTPKEVTPYAPSCDPSDQQIIDCPSCGETYWTEDWGTLNFCPNCGQAFIVKEEKGE